MKANPSCCSELYFTVGAYYSLLPLFFSPHFFVPPSARVGLYAARVGLYPNPLT
jgi:hypothetical protein